MTVKNFNFALITPSYKPDFERCKLLVESVEKCLMDDSKHYIVVDRRDIQLFKQLQSSKTELLIVEELLPSWIFRISGIKKWWMSLQTLPIRNWILQQIVKIAIFDIINEDIAVFCDSDNTFIRPFDLKSQLIKDKKIALLRVDFQNQDIGEWSESSQQLLGLTNQKITPVTYTSNMISWERQNIIRMRRHIENISGKHWICAFCSCQNISEYMLYGMFVEYIIGLEAANHFLFDVELIKPSWNTTIATEADIKDFFDNIKSEHIGVMIHSKDNFPIEIYRDTIKAFWQ